MRHDSMCNGTSQKCKLEIRDKRRKHWWWLWQAGGYALWGRKQTEKISEIFLRNEKNNRKKKFVTLVTKRATIWALARYLVRLDNLIIDVVIRKRLFTLEIFDQRMTSSRWWCRFIFFFSFWQLRSRRKPGIFRSINKGKFVRWWFQLLCWWSEDIVPKKIQQKKEACFFRKSMTMTWWDFGTKMRWFVLFFGWSGECWTRLTFHRSAAATAVYFHAIELHFLRCARSKRTKEKTRPDLG